MWAPGKASLAGFRIPQGGSGSPGNARPPGGPRSPEEVRDVTLPHSLSDCAWAPEHRGAESGDLPPRNPIGLEFLTSPLLPPRRKQDPGERLARSGDCRLASRGICCLGARGGAPGWGRLEGELKRKVTCLLDGGGRGKGGAERAWVAMGAGEAVAVLGWSARLGGNLLILCVLTRKEGRAIGLKAVARFARQPVREGTWSLTILRGLRSLLL